MKYKLLRIAKTVRGNLCFHFEINEKVYFYGFRGINNDGKMFLICTRTHKTELKKYSPCLNSSYILPTEFLQEIYQKSPIGSPYPICLDKSDPRVYDVENYYINSFEMRKEHKCPGTELENYNYIYNKP